MTWWRRKKILPIKRPWNISVLGIVWWVCVVVTRDGSQHLAARHPWVSWRAVRSFPLGLATRYPSDQVGHDCCPKWRSQVAKKRWRNNAGSWGNSGNIWEAIFWLQIEKITDVCMMLRIRMAWPKFRILRRVWEADDLTNDSRYILYTFPEINPRNRKNKRVRLVPGRQCFLKLIGPRQSKEV